MASRGRPKTSKIRVRPNWDKRSGSYLLCWIDPLTLARHQESANTAKESEARVAAAELQVKLTQQGGLAASGSWQNLLDAMEMVYRPSVKNTTWKEYYRTAMHWQRLFGEFHDLGKVNQSHIRDFYFQVPGGFDSKSKHMRQLKAIFNFAKAQGLMPSPPPIKVPAPRQGFAGKGVPRSSDEIEAVFDALDEYYGPIMADSWIFALRGMLHSGLRVSEMMALTWDSPPVRLQITKVRGVDVVTIYIAYQKSGKIEEAPTTREFAELVLSTPKEKRRGFVFNPESYRRTRIQDPTTISGNIQKAMRAAGIKFTSHDMDRTFADNLSRTKTQQVLSKFTRRTPTVLAKYYAKLRAQELSYEEMTKPDTGDKPVENARIDSTAEKKATRRA